MRLAVQNDRLHVVTGKDSVLPGSARPSTRPGELLSWTHRARRTEGPGRGRSSVRQEPFAPATDRQSCHGVVHIIPSICRISSIRFRRTGEKLAFCSVEPAAVTDDQFPTTHRGCPLQSGGSVRMRTGRCSWGTVLGADVVHSRKTSFAVDGDDPAPLRPVGPTRHTPCEHLVGLRAAARSIHPTLRELTVHHPYRPGAVVHRAGANYRTPSST